MASITLRWVQDQMMVATGSNGRSVTLGRVLEGGEPIWVGVKPSELLLMAAASCATWDIIEILAKQKEPLRDLQVQVTSEQMSDPPYTFTKIHLHYIAYGAVNPVKLDKAINLSQDKYCSVISTLRPGVPVTSDCEVRE